eukprot:EG_transcript_16911
MERLFWEAYKSYKLDPLASLYEQGHMNTVFLLGCQVKYTLTHLVVLGLDPANAEPTPAEYALIHVCQWFEPAAKKLAAMKRHLNTAFRPHSVARLGILHRLLDRLDVLNINVTRKLRTTSYAGIEHSRSLIAAYSNFVSHRNVSHMCEVGYHGGHSATVALFANPAASLTVFNTAAFPSTRDTLEFLRSSFPNRVVEMPGRLPSSLKAYAGLVGRGQHPRCETILLPRVALGLEMRRTLGALQPIMAPAGHAFVAGDSPFLVSTPALEVPSRVQYLGCRRAATASHQAGLSHWCLWRFIGR